MRKRGGGGDEGGDEMVRKKLEKKDERNHNGLHYGSVLSTQYVYVFTQKDYQFW